MDEYDEYGNILDPIQANRNRELHPDEKGLARAKKASWEAFKWVVPGGSLADTFVDQDSAGDLYFTKPKVKEAIHPGLQLVGQKFMSEFGTTTHKMPGYDKKTYSQRNENIIDYVLSRQDKNQIQTTQTPNQPLIKDFTSGSLKKGGLLDPNRVNPNIMFKEDNFKTTDLNPNDFNDLKNNSDPFYNSISNLPSNEQQEIEKYLKNYSIKERNNLASKLGLDTALKRNPNLTIGSQIKRDVAGFIHLEDIKDDQGNLQPGLLRIAKEDNRSISDVYNYLKSQDIGNKELKSTIKLLNELKRKDTVQEIKNKLNTLAKSGNFQSRTYKRWLRLLNYAEYAKTYELGHKDSLFQMFLRSATGGNRISNEFIQNMKDYEIKTVGGETIVVQGNRSLGSLKDLPIYTIVKLRGGSRDLKEDFRKTIMPKEFPSESIGEEYEEVADIIYRNSMSEVEKDFNPNDPDYEANISAYSFALTDALHAMMKKADDLGISYVAMEDEYLIEIPNSINKKKKAQLVKVYDTTLRNTLSNLNVDF